MDKLEKTLLLSVIFISVTLSLIWLYQVSHPLTMEINSEEKPQVLLTQQRPFQGPVQPTMDEDLFRKTGISKELIKE